MGAASKLALSCHQYHHFLVRWLLQNPVAILFCSVSYSEVNVYLLGRFLKTKCLETMLFLLTLLLSEIFISEGSSGWISGNLQTPWNHTVCREQAWALPCVGLVEDKMSPSLQKDGLLIFVLNACQMWRWVRAKITKMRVGFLSRVYLISNTTKQLLNYTAKYFEGTLDTRNQSSKAEKCRGVTSVHS